MTQCGDFETSVTELPDGLESVHPIEKAGELPLIFLLDLKGRAGQQ